MHVARLIQVVIPDDHDEDDETETEANEDDGTRHDGSEDVMGRHTAARHQSDFICFVRRESLTSEAILIQTEPFIVKDILLTSWHCYNRKYH